VQETTLRLTQEHGLPRRQEWVTAGMPFARRAFRPEDGIRVEGVSALTTLPLVLWPDGSVKWLRLRFRADTEAAVRGLPVSFGPGVPAAGALPAAAGATAAPRPRVGADTLQPGSGVWTGLELAVRVRTSGGACFERLRVETVAVAAEGACPGTGPELRGHLLAADGSPQVLDQTGTGSCVADSKGAWTFRCGNAVAASGKRTDGWLDLQSTDGGLAVGVREFLEKCPRTFAVRCTDGAQAIEVGVWPASEGQVLRFAQGTRLTAEIALARHAGALVPPEREARMASVVDPLQAVFPPPYLCRTGVFGPVTATPGRRFEGYFAATRDAAEAERVLAEVARVAHRRMFHPPGNGNPWSVMCYGYCG